jgi:hypothetical protein
LSFSGEIKISRKHTRFIERDLPQLVEVAIGRLGEQRRLQETRIGAYKTYELTDSMAHDLVIRATKDIHVLPNARIPDVIDEWRAPRHHEFREGGKTVWRLFNAFSEIAKGALTHLPRRMMALHGLLDSHCGLLTHQDLTGLASPQDAEIVQAI